MQRDWDVVRKILLKLEAVGDTTSEVQSDDVNGCDPEKVSYHMRLLDEAGLIRAKCRQHVPLNCVALSLTWRGHEFLDQIRQDTVWNKIKDAAREKGLSLSLDVISGLAKSIIASILE
ncbi:MAG: DUF2513 domain-containing protein [Nitrospira sp.]|nr:MAG: DUF2513 domain-containing protein [Nitrospira sp.]